MATLCSGIESVPIWLCPPSNPSHIVHFPLSYNCSSLTPPTDATSKSVTLHVLRPNTKQYASSASWCKIITKSASFAVNFFGARRLQREERTQTVSLDHCRMMISHHRCEYGAMHTSGTCWPSANELIINWPNAPFGCCRNHSISVTDLFYIPLPCTQGTETIIRSPRSAAYIHADTAMVLAFFLTARPSSGSWYRRKSADTFLSAKCTVISWVRCG